MIYSVVETHNGHNHRELFIENELTKLREMVSLERFRKEISHHLRWRTPQDVNLTSVDLVLDEEEAHMNMLSSSRTGHAILLQKNGTFVILEDNSPVCAVALKR